MAANKETFEGSRQSRHLGDVQSLRNLGIIKESKQVIQRLRDEDLVKDMDVGRKAIDLDGKKSDGTNLYITRDIAGALDRREEFGFEKMIYVMDNAQGHHFQNLFRILSWLESEVSACQVSEDSGHQLQKG